MHRPAFPALALVATLAHGVPAQADPGGGAPASRAATEPGLPSLAQLTELVHTAHGGSNRHRAIESFRAEVDVTKLEGGKVTVPLGVRFRQKELLRYEIKEGETKKERGIDTDGPWAAVGRDVIRLDEGRSETELQLLEQHLAICQQLVRFVDPAELLASMLKKSGPSPTTIDLARDELAVPCLRVTGYAKGFPLFHLPAKAKAEDVRVELYIDARQHRLRAIGAQPLDAAARPLGSGEWITLNDLEDVKGYLLPRTITVWEPGTAPKQLASIEIKKIHWNPRLDDADFARPKR